MTPPQNLKEYKFFEQIERYIKAEKDAENAVVPPDISKECISFSKVLYKSEYPSIAKQICEKFAKRYISLYPSLDMSTSDPNYIKDWAFLNYWLNCELNKSVLYKNTYVKEFYHGMEGYVQDKLNYLLLTNDEIFDINKDELDKIHILFNLYTDYHKIYSNDKLICAQKSICLDYSKKCVEEYKKGIIKCEKNESDFCKAIRVFEKEYERLIQNNKKMGDFNTKDLITLPSYEVALKEYQSELYRRKISIAIISIICSIFGIILILFYLYKFTPFGKWLPINKKNQEKRHAMKEKMYNFIDNSNEYSTYNEYTPYRVGYNST
ncbi:PIR protein [Plasmodium vivax]|uniref:VIR protein n=1 Tax=Plasmodium vivax TaxID=5855 RepID=A0A564ZMW2_PLAVI|nr:PIR protein [Plasmodium vivax]